jgi:hypothetical protein
VCEFVPTTGELQINKYKKFNAIIKTARERKKIILILITNHHPLLEVREIN